MTREREQFEEWWDCYIPPRADNPATSAAWKAWQASRAAALEEARIAAERAILEWSATHAGDLGSGPASVAAIRALLAPPK